MTKRELVSFIDSREGSHWDDIRRRMRKMKVKEQEKMTQFLGRKDKSNDDDKEEGSKGGDAANRMVAQ